MRRTRRTLGFIGWLALTTAGLVSLWSYAARPGASGTRSEAWPAGLGLARASDRATLVMSVHAACPCSQATIAELGELTGRTRVPIQVYVLVVPAPGQLALESPIARSAAKLPGVSVVADPGAKRSHAVGALTSGHTAVYDAVGKLLFAGGITGSRGHAGNNEGRASVLALLERRAASDRTVVFGCPIGPEGDAK